MKNKEALIQCMGDNIRLLFRKIDERLFESIEAIRFRNGKPLIVRSSKTEYYLSSEGAFVTDPTKAYITTAIDMTSTLALISGYSMYAFEEEIRNGFITLQGGHRIGISGKVIMEEGKVKTIRNISSLNIRIAHEAPGCADELIPYIAKDGLPYHTLLVSPPGCGKTTLLRDLIRTFSDAGKNVGVVDERSEIAGSFLGIAQNDVGVRTDILDSCPKAQGMQMLLRSMSPDIIAVDEIGRRDDIFAIEEVLNAGIRLISSVHGSSLDDLKKKPVLNEFIKRHIFGRTVILSNRNGPGTVEGIYDEAHQIVKEGAL